MKEKWMASIHKNILHLFNLFYFISFILFLFILFSRNKARNITMQLSKYLIYWENRKLTFIGNVIKLQIQNCLEINTNIVKWQQNIYFRVNIAKVFIVILSLIYEMQQKKIPSKYWASMEPALEKFPRTFQCIHQVLLQKTRVDRPVFGWQVWSHPSERWSNIPTSICKIS